MLQKYNNNQFLFLFGMNIHKFENCNLLFVSLFLFIPSMVLILLIFLCNFPISISRRTMSNEYTIFFQFSYIFFYTSTTNA